MELLGASEQNQTRDKDKFLNQSKISPKSLSLAIGFQLWTDKQPKLSYTTSFPLSCLCIYIYVYI